VKKTSCLICLRALPPGSVGEVHPACTRRLYGGDKVPSLAFGLSDLNALAEQLVRRHVSVPGVQPKLSLHLERAAGGRLTLVDMEGEFILKPPAPDYPELPELEHATLNLAAAAGLPVCQSGLIRTPAGELCLLVRRMDRDENGKLAMEDFCQLSDRLTDEKYRGSLERAGKVVRQHSHLPGLDTVAFLELAVFCFLTGNADMHLKNFSLLTGRDGRVRLAPAYDLVPTALLLAGDAEESALTINGKKSRLLSGDFLALAKALGLTHKQGENTLARLRHALPAMREMLDVARLKPKTRARYHALLGERHGRLAFATGTA
jgi:serine/threonine-protein kinase HipA